ncbi:follicle-stimulating hormone receptor-like isoform X2 [Rhodnius prolixus]
MPLVVEEGENSLCTCWDEPRYNAECQCQGDQLTFIPANLTKHILRLTIQNSGIKTIYNDSLTAYRDTLKEFTLMNNNELEGFESAVFRDMPTLSTIYIFHAPKLKYLEDELFQVDLPRLRVLRIVHCGLENLPPIKLIPTKTHFSLMDLENNMLNVIRERNFQVTADQLLLNYNQIAEVERRAFHGSQIEKLSLRGNKELRVLHPDSFEGIKSLRQLDLSETAIIKLPTAGLHNLEELQLQNVRTLKIFPSIYNFQYIRKVSLTYAYHCCAFHFPGRHDPARYAKHHEFLRTIQSKCSRRSRRSWESPPQPDISPHYFPDGTFHQEGVTLEPGKRMTAECGNLSKDFRKVECIPEPDAFNPCEDLMGNWTLRVAVWIVAVAALLGNTAVLLVLLSSRFRMTVPKFLMCNLAIADLCMGLYLIMIAIMDAKSIGDYFNYAIDWQSGLGCQIAGFLTVFSSELSILTLTVITCERWYTITYAIHMNKRLKLSTAVKIMAAGWIYAIIMALLPLVGVSGYYKTSICLPMENSSAVDVTYLTTLLTFNGFAFWLICLCYSRMYCSIKRGREQGAALMHSDMTVAKRMALLVFTDFACWAPIAFFGLTALAGYPLIDVTNTKILIVFFYPLNSCANPYLYALLTHQYRRDVFILLSRYGVCSERAARYKGTVGAGAGCGGGAEGGRGPRQCASRGSVLTTLTSFDCANSGRQSGGNTAATGNAIINATLSNDSIHNKEHHKQNGTSVV